MITGIGVLSPIGHDIDSVRTALRDGCCGIRPATKIDMSSFRANHAGEIRDFSPDAVLSQEVVGAITDPYLIYALAAAKAACNDAGLVVERGRRQRSIAMVLGTCNGGLVSAESQYRTDTNGRPATFNHQLHLQSQFYGFGKALAYFLGLGGESWIATTACSSTTVALTIAGNLIRLGYYDAVLVGGADGLSLANIAGFDGLKATTPEINAPFSTPIGLNVGEASCFWILENSAAAAARSARVYGCLAGYATTLDGHHPTAPHPGGDGACTTLQLAIENAGLTIDDIGCINLHGTGTELNDKAESRGVARLLDNRKVPCSATKSFFGHCMGSAGILEATCNLVAMLDDFIPPTLHFREPRPGCNLDYVPNQSRACNYDAFASANYAFGGSNAAVVITRTPADAAPASPLKRVVLTGCGAVSSLGLHLDAILDALHRDEVGLGDVNGHFEKCLGSRRIGFVEDFTDRDICRRLDFTDMNKISRMATAAAWMALDTAGLRPSRRDAGDFGIAVGLCNGSDETAHMKRTFATANHVADIGSFSNITPNSVTGWVSTALYLKGANTTITNGPHAAMSSLAFAYDTIRLGDSRYMLAGGADEAYELIYGNYNFLNWVCLGDDEVDYRIRMDNTTEKVLGEGAAFAVLESADNAAARTAPVLAEILGYGFSTDGDDFFGPCLDACGLDYAVSTALQRSGIAVGEIDLIIWAPQGNVQDKKMLDIHRKYWHSDKPMVTTTFHTGFVESSSILMSLACVLASLDRGRGVWPQRTGVPTVDRPVSNTAIRNVLAIAGSDIGYNYAVVLQRP